MKLNPRTPPGRSNRKARAFSAEIERLAMDGYGNKAIHEALADAGMSVSKSTVQRELARLSRPVRPIALHRVAPPAPAPPILKSPKETMSEKHPPTGEQPSGKDIAEEFLKGRITNPLFRKRI